MRKTSTCPKCEKPIALIEAPEASIVECPLCLEQFELSEAVPSDLESEEGDSPPLLIIVERRGDEDLGEFFASLALDESPDGETPTEATSDAKDGEKDDSEGDEDLDSFFANLVADEPTEVSPFDADATEEQPAGQEASEEPAFSEAPAGETLAEPPKEEVSENLVFDEETIEEEISESDTPALEAGEEQVFDELEFDEETPDAEAAEEADPVGEVDGDLESEEEASEEETTGEITAREPSEELFFGEEIIEEATTESDASGVKATDEEQEFDTLEFDEELPGGDTVGEAASDDQVPDKEPAGQEEDGEIQSEEEPSEQEETPKEPSEGDVSDEEDSDEEDSDDLTLAEEPPVQVRCPCCLESFDLEDLLLAETNKSLGAEAASAILADGSVKETPNSADGMQFNFGAMDAADDDHSGFRLASDAEGPSDSSGAFEFAAPVGADTDPAERSEAARAKRRRRERGGMRELWEAMLGGAAGLLITYYCLNLFGGPRFDWFKVYLPFVKHTAVHRPEWLGGPPTEEFDSGISDGLETDEETPKSPPKPAKPADDTKIQDTPPPEEPNEEPPAEPMATEAETSVPDYVGPLDTPDVSSDDLGQALREISQLPKDGTMTEEAYELWCRVAQAATFLDPKDGAPQTQNRLNTMRRLMKGLSIADVREIGRLATRRAVNPDRANNGILLAGLVRKPNSPSGNGFITGFVTAETGAQISLASDRKLPIQPEDRVLVVGYLVDDPNEVIQGLATELPLVTWVQIGNVVKFQGSGK